MYSAGPVNLNLRAGAVAVPFSADYIYNHEYAPSANFHRGLPGVMRRGFPVQGRFARHDRRKFHQNTGSTHTTALGGAYTALYGPDSVLYNPAGLGLMNYSVLSVAHNTYMEGISQDYAAMALRTNLGTFGLTLNTLRSGDFKAYDNNGAGIGNTSSSHQLWIFSWGQMWPHFDRDRGYLDKMLITPEWSRMKVPDEYRSGADKIAVGASLKLVKERLDDASASSTSGDVGLIYVPHKHTHLGLAVQNIFGSQKFDSEAYALPRTIRAGIARDWETKSKLIIMLLSVDAVKESDRSLYFAAGTEANIIQAIQLRFGYKSNADLGNGISAGMGLSLDRLGEGALIMKGVRVDYAFVSQGMAGTTHRIGLQMLFF